MLEALLARWRRGQVLALALRAVGVALGAGALGWAILPASAIGVGAGLLLTLAAALGSLWLPHPPMADRQLLASHLDRVFAELEDSSDLLYRPAADLTGLEALQQRRLDRVLKVVPQAGLWPRSQVLGALRILVGGAALALLVLVGQTRWARSGIATPGDSDPSAKNLAVEIDPLRSLIMEIHPPAYTGTESTQQETLDLEVLAGSTIRWRVPPTDQSLELVFAGREPIPFSAGDEGSQVDWVARESGVYRLRVSREQEEILSPYARLAVIPDEPPKLSFVRPEERVTIVSGSTALLDLTVEAQDDYGLREVDLVMTLAQGSGELVEFRQLRRPLRAALSGIEATLTTALALAEMGLQSGSELYLHVEARDNREPAANMGRTGTYIVRIPADRVLSADLGEGIPVVLPPEYFRSQRQIIIDTEKLIATEKELSIEEFRRRSESLGFDQRALRMRYGTLLGEEFESGRPVGAGEGESGDHDDHALEGIPSELVHFHDSAEIATFFTSEIRTQLKQVLAEMWDAEGRLRVHQPPEALPFEYRALELLKDLQQRSRIFVQKVGFETPPLEPEKLRLTGELEEIATRTRALEPEQASRLEEAIRALLRDLAAENQTPGVLAGVSEALIRAALAEQVDRVPDAVESLEILDRWSAGDPLDPDQRDQISAALWSLLPAPDLRPDRRRASADPLAQLFRDTLSEAGRP